MMSSTGYFQVRTVCKREIIGFRKEKSINEDMIDNEEAEEYTEGYYRVLEIKGV